jgi:hypothetical protein
VVVKESSTIRSQVLCMGTLEKITLRTTQKSARPCPSLGQGCKSVNSFEGISLQKRFLTGLPRNIFPWALLPRHSETAAAMVQGGPAIT